MWCFQKSFKNNLSCKTNQKKKKKEIREANVSIFLGSKSDSKLQSALLELTFPTLLWTLVAGAISELWTLQLLLSSEYQVHCKLFFSFLIWMLSLAAPLPLSSLKSSVSECFSVKSYSFFSQRLPWLLVPLLSVCFQFLTEQTHLQAKMSFLTMSMKWISFQIAPVITSIFRGNFSLRLIRSVDKNNIMPQKGPVKHLMFQKANIEFPALYLQQMVCELKHVWFMHSSFELSLL